MFPIYARFISHIPPGKRPKSGKERPFKKLLDRWLDKLSVTFPVDLPDFSLSVRRVGNTAAFSIGAKGNA